MTDWVENKNLHLYSIERMQRQDLCKAHDEKDLPCRRKALPGYLVCKKCLKRYKEAKK